MKTKKMKLGTSVCVFCKHCVPDEEYRADWEDNCISAFLCTNCPNQEVVHPVTGRRLYISYSEKPVNEALDIMNGDFEYNKKDKGVNIDIEFSSQKYQYCCEINRWGYCKDFVRISKKKEEERFGKIKKKDISVLFKKALDKDS